MSDLDKLKNAAEVAYENPKLGWPRFNEFATPATILALIERLEKAEAESGHLRDAMNFHANEIRSRVKTSDEYADNITPDKYGLPSAWKLMNGHFLTQADHLERAAKESTP
jgi:hypothetical protein